MTSVETAEVGFAIAGSGRRGWTVHFDVPIEVITTLIESSKVTIEQVVTAADQGKIAGTVVFGTVAAGALVVGEIESGRITDSCVINR